MNTAVDLRSLGIWHFQTQDFAKACVFIDRYLQRGAGDCELYNYQARALEALGRLPEALSFIDRSLALHPHNIEELCNRALLLARLSRREEALDSLERALTVDPDHAGVLIKRAVLLHQLGRREDALLSATRAVKTKPTDLEALNTRGMIYDDLDYRDQAREDFLAVLKIDPDHPGAITNVGILHGRSGEFREALDSYDRSLALNPEQPNAVYNRAVVRLVLGDWRQGFRDFESRWKLFPHEAARLTRLAPQWRGEADIAGKTILLHHEQGYGDTLQFSRYAPLVAARGARVVLAVPAGLKTLMSTLPGSPQVVGEGESVPVHDLHCPLMSLPLAFSTTPESVPHQVPYLKADPERVREWAARLSSIRRPKIGLVWSGRRYPPINYARDMSLELVRPLIQCPADFICLHTELSQEEKNALAPLSNVHCLGSEVNDFADTAALIENLDLIITVDSAVAHLSGALGKPVWLMNRYASCWRWLLDRSDSPWYPTMRLFRQPALGDWARVVREVSTALEQSMWEGSLVRAEDSAPSPSGNLDLSHLLQEALDSHNQGHLTRAIGQYRDILKSYPGQFDTLHFLGVALAQNGESQAALEPLSAAIAIRPDDALVQNHYGNALSSVGAYTQAVDAYRRALAQDDTVADFHFNLGVALTELPDSTAALAAYDHALALDSTHARALNNRGNLLASLGRQSDALASFDQALAIRPTFVDSWINRCHLLRRLHRYEEALSSSEKSIEYAPTNPDAYNSHGATCADIGRFDEAMVSYGRALAIDPAAAEPRWNTGLIKLAQGDYASGWPLYEARWNVKSLKLVPPAPRTQILGRADSINGKVVVVHAEQGYGDTLQFSRYVALLAARGAQVIFSVPTSLVRLLKSVAGVHRVVPQHSASVGDYQVSVMSLPYLMETTLDTIPSPTRYLLADPVLARKWTQRTQLDYSKPRVGIAWSGRPSHANDLNRSMSIDDLKPLMQGGIQWISLQKEICGDDVLRLDCLPVARFDGELSDFAETAALIEHLDLVITVDTSVAHLAGALGKPVWILLPHVADWRWLLERTDSPWYASARLFRQSRRGDWASVIERINAALEERFPHANKISRDRCG